jgi:two-component system cell cycle sensor histidine kinase/response regulator CckA
LTAHNPSERNPDRRSSKRQRAEEALRESQELLSRHSPVYTYVKAVTRTESRILQASDNYPQMIGIPGRDAVGKTMAELFPAEFAAKITADDWAVISGGKVLELEEEFDGRSYTSIKFPIIQGDKTLLAGYTYDITERKQMEESLRRTQFTVDHSQDIVLWVTPEGRFLYVNDACCRRLGYSREELLGMTVSDVGLATPQPWSSHFQKVREQGYFTFESSHKTKDGEVFPVEVSVNYLNYEGQEYGCASARDISGRKQVEEERLARERQLQQSQRLESLGMLAGGIAHDFNNILTGVLGNADLALMGLPPGALARENLLEITRASHRAAALCQQMLAYSGRGKFVVEPLDLSALVQDMIDLLKSTISKKARVNLNLGKDLPPMRGDSSQLSQVIMNLVINASEALGDEDGVITISTGSRECSSEYLRKSYASQDLPPGLYLTLEVSDTGCGMDQQTQERLFEPFFTTKFTGRGLGLAAVLGIVRGHRGALRVYSELGKGTTFKIRFPAAQAGEGEPPPRHSLPETHDWKGKGTVLLVDDEETVRALGTRMLSQLGFAVLAAADGREALTLYAEHPGEIALVFLDLTMPRMDGEETFRELRRLDPGVLVVMSSGYTEHDITSRFAAGGPAGFLQKPYTLAQLAERLRNALDG